MENEEQKRPAHRPPLDDREKVASSHIHFRVTRRRKAAYVKAAQKKKGQTLVDWCFKHLDKASAYEGD
jgi:hypothetical protein